MQQASSSNSTALADAYTSQNGDIASDPAILFNHDVAAQGLTTTTLTTSRIDGVGSTHELDVGAEDAPISNRDGAGIRDTAVGANQNIVADIDVVAIVAVEWCLDSAILANAANGHDTPLRIITAIRRQLRRGAAGHDFPKTSLPFLEAGSVGWVGGIVEAPDSSHAIFAVLGEGRREGGVVVAL